MFINLRQNLFALIALFTVAFSPSLYAQQNFLNGFIINSQGDTINGQIDYRNWDINPTEISFKAENNLIETYNMFQISGFKVADEYYQSAKVKIETSSHLTNQLTQKSALNLEEKQVFLQALVIGSKNLYYLKDESGKDHFYFEADGNIQLLIYKKYLEGRLLIHNRTYRGQLDSYLSTCDKLSNGIKNVAYNKKSLSQLLERYYQCTLSKPEFSKQPDKLKGHLGLIGGLALSNLRFTTSTFDAMAYTDFPQSVGVALGFSGEFFLARGLQKLSIHNELFFSHYNVSGSVTIQNTTNFSNTTYDSELGYSYIKLNNMFRYNFSLHKANLFFGVGFANGVAISETNFQSRTIQLFNSTRVLEELAIDVPRKYEQSLLFGLGIRMDRYSLEIRKERGNGMSNVRSLASKANRLFFLFGYRL